MNRIELKVINSRDLGAQFRDNPHRMVGQDGAFSIPMNSESLWFFGDTLIGRRPPEDKEWYINGFAFGAESMKDKSKIDAMLTNTGLLLPNQTVEDGLKNYHYLLNPDGTLKTLIPMSKQEEKEGIRLWCQHGIFLNGKLYLSFIKVKTYPFIPVLGVNEQGEVVPVNFDVIGSGLAVGTPGSWKFRRVLYRGTDILWQKNDPHFGSAIVPDFANRKLYLYGVFIREDRVQKCCLARVDFDRIEDLEEYEYLASDKPEWSRRIEDAAVLFVEAPSEVSVSYNRHLSAYLAVHSWRTTNKIVGRTAPNIWGPWSKETVLWKAGGSEDVNLSKPRLFYAGKEHPELSQNNGRTIYITYIEFEEYYPHLVELTLE